MSEAQETDCAAGSSRPIGFVPGSVPESFFEPLADDELAPWGCET